MIEKITREGLPIVDEDTWKTWKRDLKQSGSSDLDAWFEEIEAENFFIARYIEINSKCYPPEHRIRAKAQLTMLYKIMKAQATNNMIEDTFT